MRVALILGLLLLLTTSVSAKTTVVQLGDTPVSIHVIGDSDTHTCVALHENETTSVAAAQGLCQRTVIISHTGDRNVSFALADAVERIFDPNRIFTAAGRRKTITPYSAEADVAVAALAEAITRELRGVVIALHNNTDDDGVGRYSVTSYLEDGNETANAQLVHQAETMDVDNFFFLTSPHLYGALVDKGYHVVLQHDEATDDGSLSVYCMLHKVAYVNVEAQHGAVGVQRQMLALLFNALDELLR